MQKIEAAELKEKMAQQQLLLLDVREPAEYRSGYIEGAHLIPLATVSLAKLPQTDLPIVTYCRSGRRSADACQQLLAENPTLTVSTLVGGIEAWEQAGFPIQRSGQAVLPLDRQTQVVAGAMALTGTLLGTFVQPLFYVLPGFVGAGLMFAGLTGWCGMAKLLAKMPWNQ